HLAHLVAGFAAGADHAAVGAGPGWRDLQHLDVDRQGVAGPGRARPGGLAPGADDAARQREAVNQHAHGQGRRVPAAGGQTAEQAVPGGGIIEMEGLGVELAREGLDRVGGDGDGGADEGLADLEIVQIEGRGGGHVAATAGAGAGSARRAAPDTAPPRTSTARATISKGRARACSGLKGRISISTSRPSRASTPGRSMPTPRKVGWAMAINQPAPGTAATASTARPRGRIRPGSTTAAIAAARAASRPVHRTRKAISGAAAWAIVPISRTWAMRPVQPPQA